MYQLFLENWQWSCLMCGWVVYKYQVRIFTGLFKAGGEKVGEYRTYDEARVKSHRQLRNEFPDKDIEIHDLKDKHGKYFLIEAVVGFAKFILIPEQLND